MTVLVGIDVGGSKKGFHLVALRGSVIVDYGAFSDPRQAAQRCLSIGARVVAVDAPSRWSVDGRARVAERQLMARRVFCFATPTEKRAREHAKNHFGWMIRGQELYLALEAVGLPRMTRLTDRSNGTIETFPHAAACAITERVLAAKHKRRDRQSAIEQVGIRAEVRGIDFIDAALCAIVAQKFLNADVDSFGSKADGYIVLPKSSIWAAPRP